MKKILVIYLVWYVLVLLFQIFEGQQNIEAYFGFDKVNNKEDLENSIFFSQIVIDICRGSFYFLAAGYVGHVLIMQNADADEYSWTIFILIVVRGMVDTFAVHGLENRWIILFVTCMGSISYIYLYKWLRNLKKWMYRIV